MLFNNRSRLFIEQRTTLTKFVYVACAYIIVSLFENLAKN